jgi:hypothetical protein
MPEIQRERVCERGRVAARRGSISVKITLEENGQFRIRKGLKQ